MVCHVPNIHFGKYKNIRISTHRFFTGIRVCVGWRQVCPTPSEMRLISYCFGPRSDHCLALSLSHFCVPNQTSWFQPSCGLPFIFVFVIFSTFCTFLLSLYFVLYLSESSWQLRRCWIVKLLADQLFRGGISLSYSNITQGKQRLLRLLSYHDHIVFLFSDKSSFLLTFPLQFWNSFKSLSRSDG